MGIIEELHQAHKERQERIRKAAYIDPKKVVVNPAPTPPPTETEAIMSEVMQEENPEVKAPKGPVFTSKLEAIIHQVCVYYGVRRLDLLSNRRLKNISVKRHVMCYLMYDLTSFTNGEIGRRIHRDPSTVHYGIMKIMDHFDDFREEIQELEEIIAKVFKANNL